jgi:hypothetical protein
VMKRLWRKLLVWWIELHGYVVLDDGEEHW